jgi:hypothetical protein
VVSLLYVPGSRNSRARLENPDEALKYSIQRTGSGTLETHLPEYHALPVPLTIPRSFGSKAHPPGRSSCTRTRKPWLVTLVYLIVSSA